MNITRFSKFGVLITICAGPLSAQDLADISATLVPPKESKVATIANSPIYIAVTNTLKLKVSENEIRNFLRCGKILPFDSDREKLRMLAPYTPPKDLDAFQKDHIQRWREREGEWVDVSTRYAVGNGALTTNNSNIFFWIKLNDRVLWIAQWNRACYLVLAN